MTGPDGVARIRDVFEAYRGVEITAVEHPESARGRRSFRAVIDATYPVGVLLQGRYRRFLVYGDLFTRDIEVAAPAALATALAALVAELRGEPATLVS